MAYDSSITYLPYLKGKSKKGGCGCGKKQHDHDHGCGCDSCKECSCKEEECGCCPTGLVAVFSADGKHVGCLTPNDAEEFIKAAVECEPGYAKLFNNTTNEFLGCISEAQFVTLYQQVNPS